MGIGTIKVIWVIILLMTSDTLAADENQDADEERINLITLSTGTSHLRNLLPIWRRYYDDLERFEVIDDVPTEHLEDIFEDESKLNEGVTCVFNDAPGEPPNGHSYTPTDTILVATSSLIVVSGNPTQDELTYDMLFALLQLNATSGNQTKSSSSGSVAVPTRIIMTWNSARIIAKFMNRYMRQDFISSWKKHEMFAIGDLKDIKYLLNTDLAIAIIHASQNEGYKIVNLVKTDTISYNVSLYDNLQSTVEETFLNFYSYVTVHVSPDASCVILTKLCHFLLWLMYDGVPEAFASYFGFKQNHGQDLYSLVNKLLADHSCSEVEMESDSNVYPIMLVSMMFVLGVVVIFLAIYLIHHWRISNLLQRSDWFIPSRDLLLLSTNQFRVEPNQGTDMTSFEFSTLGRQTWNTKFGRRARWHGQDVVLRHLDIIDDQASRQLSSHVKATFVWMKHNVLHSNIVRFMGITQLTGNQLHLIRDYNTSSCLSLHDVIYDVTTEWEPLFQYAVCKDIASGMSFLHSLRLVHGRLDSKCCILTSQWSVQITDWELEHIRHHMPATFRRSVKVGTEYHVSSLTDDKPAFERVCWTPPEKMIDKQRQTDRAGDVYNYGLIFLEIFWRKSPFDQLKLKQNSAALTSIKTGTFVPSIPESLSTDVSNLISLALSPIPRSRPTFPKILKALELYSPSQNTIIEECIARLTNKTNETESLKTVLHSYYSQRVPKFVADHWTNNQNNTDMLPELHQNVTFLMFELVRDSSAIPSAVQFDILSHTMTVLDDVVAKYEVDWVEDVQKNNILTTGIRGSPKTQTENILEVLSLSLDLMTNFQKKDGSIPKKYSRPKIKIVVHAGPISSGSVGTSSKFLVSGVPLEVAEKILSVAQSSVILATSGIRNHVIQSGDFKFLPSGIQVEGATELYEVHENMNIEEDGYKRLNGKWHNQLLENGNLDT